MPEREPDVEALRAPKAPPPGSLVDEVSAAFAHVHIGNGDYIVELLDPEEAKTGLDVSGLRALQHVRLRPRHEAYSIIVAATVNPFEKHAELRTFEHALLVHQIRVQRPFEISVSEWEQLLRKLEGVFQLAGIESARVGPSPDVLREARHTKLGRRIAPRALLLFVVVLVLAAYVMVRVFQKLAAG